MYRVLLVHTRTWTRPRSYAPRRRTPFRFPWSPFCGCSAGCQGTYMYECVWSGSKSKYCALPCLVPCLLGMTTVCAHPWLLVCVSHAHIHQSILFILSHSSIQSIPSSQDPPPVLYSTCACHAANGVSPTTCSSVNLHDAAPDVRPCRTPYILKGTGRPCGCSLSFSDLRVIRVLLVIVSG